MYNDDFVREQFYEGLIRQEREKNKTKPSEDIILVVGSGVEVYG